MRADMAKVLVERPRPRSRDGHAPAKGYRRRVRAELAADATSPREGMKRRYSNLKWFNENLAPLRRFLDSNVGRPWDAVYSEICQRVDRGNVVQKHVLTHLFDYVVVHTVEVDGRPYDATPGNRYGTPLRRSRWPGWYVCPRTGLLRRSLRERREPATPRPTPRHVRVGDCLMCVEIDGRWRLATVAALAPRALGRPRFDAVLKRQVSHGDAEVRRLYGADLFAVSVRDLSRRELRSLPVPR